MKPWCVAWHEGARIIRQALASTPGTRVRLEALGHQTRRLIDVQVITIVGSQATGVDTAEYELTVVALASTDARATSLPEHNNNPILAGKGSPPLQQPPFHTLVFSLGGMVNGSTTKVLASWKQELWVEHRRLGKHAMHPLNRSLGSSSSTNSASWRCNLLRARWGHKPIRTQRDLPQESAP
jgi:hypothetical protein